MWPPCWTGAAACWRPWPPPCKPALGPGPSTCQAACKACCLVRSTHVLALAQSCAIVVPCARRSAGEEDAKPDEDFSRLKQRITEAAERRAAAQKQFDRLCSICIAAHQACPLCADKNPSSPHLLLQPRPACLLLWPKPSSRESAPPGYCSLEWTMPKSAFTGVHTGQQGDACEW